VRGKKSRYILPMPNEVLTHPGYRVVCKKMRDIVEEFHGDVAHLARLSTDELFSLVEKIPYVMDGDVWGGGREAIARPARFRELRGLDCKKKAILVGCWARCRGIGYRFVAVDDTGNGISHVFAEVEEVPGWWVSMDCTIPGLFRPGAPMPNVRYAEVF
jgi:hypothetical protein